MTADYVDSPLEYYSRQGSITNPGDHATLFEGLPADIPSLCAVIQTITIHYEVGQMSGVELTEKRREERELRHVSTMLARIMELDDRPLTKARPPEKRLMINCRDSSALFCSMLRHHGIPARCRRGFVNYFRGPTSNPDYRGDHWACEYWNSEKLRWVTVDAEIDEVERRIYEITINPLDVSPDEFMTAGKAWQLCRNGTADPEFFGSPDEHGLWFVRSSLVTDLAALNKMELLCWDGWGLADRQSDLELAEDDLSLLDQIAELTEAGDRAFGQLRRMYETGRSLRVPPVIKSYRESGICLIEL